MTRRLHPTFIDAVRTAPVPQRALARLSGLPNTRLSTYVNGRRVPNTTLANERVYRLADLLGHPRTQVFAPEDRP